MIYSNKNESKEIREIFENMKSHHEICSDILTEDVWEQIKICRYDVNGICAFFEPQQHWEHLIQYANQNYWFTHKDKYSAIFTCIEDTFRAIIYNEELLTATISNRAEKFTESDLIIFPNEVHKDEINESDIIEYARTAVAEYLILCYSDYNTNGFISPLEFQEFFYKIGFFDYDLEKEYPKWWEANSEENKLMRLPKYPLLAYAHQFMRL